MNDTVCPCVWCQVAASVGDELRLARWRDTKNGGAARSGPTCEGKRIAGALSCLEGSTWRCFAATGCS